MALAGFQRKIGNQLGVKPGSEMLEAIKLAETHNIPIALVDRDIAITLKRAWRKTPFYKKMVLLSNMLAGFFSKQEINEEELNTLRKSDVVTELMKDLQKYLPEAKTVLVDERDQYLVSKTIESLNDEKEIVLVVGAGHVKGIKECLENNKENEINLKLLEEIPPVNIYMQVLPWLLPVAILIAFGYGFSLQNYSSLKTGVLIWILSTGVLGSIGTALALAHPLSILSAFIAAPITALHPAIGCGFVVGLVEAFESI